MLDLSLAWRYGIISRGLRIPREKDCLSPGDYAAFRIEDAYLPGRVLDVVGDHPPILKVCMFQGKSLCSYSSYSGDCKTFCRKWLFTTANHAGVLTMSDIYSIFEGSAGSLRSADPRCVFLDSKKAGELFMFLDRLQARQEAA